MRADSETGKTLSTLIDDIVNCYGDGKGPFCPDRARIADADANLESLGLGHSALGVGKLAKAGPPERVIALVESARSGDSASFDAAMRYLALRLFGLNDVPQELVALGADKLLGKVDRPPRRKATAQGLSVRDLAVYLAVEYAITLGETAASAYEAVAREMRNRRFHPNSAKSVKRVHLATRKFSADDLTLHHLALIRSIHVFPNGFIFGPAAEAFDRLAGKEGHD